MNLEALHTTLNNLYGRNLLVVQRNPDLFDTVFHMRFVYNGRLIDEEIDIVPALRKKALQQIVLGAINGNLPDMTTVSLLYASGFCLETDLHKAMAWASFAMMQPAEHATYAEAIQALKADYKLAASNARGDDMIWIPEMEDTIDTVLDRCNNPRKYEGQKVVRGALVTPRLAGVRINLVYRGYKVDGEFRAHLYGAFLHMGGKIVYAMDELRYLNVPLQLGMHGQKQIFNNYVPFGTNAKLYVVQGTLVAPKKQREQMRARFPDVRTVKDLYEEYLKSLSRTRLNSFGFVTVGFREKLKDVEKRLGMYAKKPKKFAEKIADLQKRKEKLEKRIATSVEQERAAKAEYEQTLPETYLRFVATGMFVHQNGKLLAPQARIKPSVHLQSLGFTTLSHPLTEIVGLEIDQDGVLSGFDNYIAKFEQAYDDQYTVTGLMIRPGAESVKINRCYSYTKSKGE